VGGWVGGGGWVAKVSKVVTFLENFDRAREGPPECPQGGRTADAVPLTIPRRARVNRRIAAPLVHIQNLVDDSGHVTSSLKAKFAEAYDM